jgi:tetratricopeptide (TPR) repeat protein/ferredoxin
MGLHIAHWKISGRTLAPLELNEVMYTLELGIVTAGFIFMVVAFLSALIFGRFFCSWGCHILALQDLSAWLLEKVGIRPKPVRSRLLLLVAPSAMFYMFIWPQIARLASGGAPPTLHLQTDAEGWASFTTNDFWRNLPGPGVALMTFAVCGFAIVYLLGSRSFCRYACPYGAIFAIADRFAPGRLVAKGGCEQCGLCTAACSSGVRVHQELTVFGQVVDPACLKVLDCLQACPNDAIGYGFTRPSLFRSWRRAFKRPRFDYSIGEELLIAVVFVATLLIFRGLYASVPFLMTLGLGGILAFLAVHAARLVYAPNVRLNIVQLKLKGRITRAGGIGAVVAVLVTLFVLHCGFIRYHEFAGHKAYESGHLDEAIEHLTACDRWGLVRPPQMTGRLAAAHASVGESLAEQGRFPEAVDHLDASVMLAPGDAPTRYNLAVSLSAMGRDDEALHHYRAAKDLDPDDVEIRNNLGFLLARHGRVAEASAEFQAAIRLDPDYAHPYFNLGRLLLAADRVSEAEVHFRRAAALDATYAELLGVTPPARTGP